MTEQNNPARGQIDFEAICRTTARLGYSSSLATKLKTICGWFDIKTHGDIVDIYSERRKKEEEKRNG